MDLSAVCWPADQLPAALLALRRAAGLPTGPDAPQPERVPVQCRFGELEAVLDRAAPAVLRVGFADDAPLLLLCGGGPQLLVLGPAGMARVPRATVAAAMGAAVVAAVAAERGALTASLPPAAVAALHKVWLAERALLPGWILRLPAEAPVGALLQEAGVGGLIGRLALAQGLGTLLGLGGLALTGGAALVGSLDGPAVLLWGLLAASALPVGLATQRWRAELGLRLGLLFRRRLLLGTTRLLPEELRADGLGGHLGRMLDAGEVEGLALGMGLATLTAPVDLLLAAGIIAAAPGGGLLLLAFLAVIALGLGLGWLRWRRLRAEVGARQRLSRGLIERMTGHQTRLAALAPSAWHVDEDAELRPYAEAMADQDRATLALRVGVGPLWTFLGVAALLPTLVAGAPPAALAVAVAGLLFGGAALAGASAGLDALLGAALAWERVGVLWRAAARSPLSGLAQTQAALHRPIADGAALIEGIGLDSRHPGRARPTLSAVDLHLSAGAQVLVEGPSGAGKSSLMALLAGHRRPDGGLLLLRGLDLPSLGEGPWRRAVVLAPQLHQNHIFSNSLLFNLRLGCSWPPTADEEADTRALCEALGLGPLLHRMPSGLLQPVGETGWQLSHGERSRIFLARALLQRPLIVILDESFAALDPHTITLALDTARRRAHTLVVIAHP